MKNTESKFISDFGKTSFKIFKEVAWPSGLRRWFKAPVSSEAWVRIPPLPKTFDFQSLSCLQQNRKFFDDADWSQSLHTSAKVYGPISISSSMEIFCGNLMQNKNQNSVLLLAVIIDQRRMIHFESTSLKYFRPSNMSQGLQPSKAICNKVTFD